MKIRKEKMLLSLDPGNSTSKMLYQIYRGHKDALIKYMIMGPECLALSSESADFFANGMFAGRSEDNAWVRLKKDGEIMVLGRMAREYRATSRIKPLKAMTMIPKILAAIGAIAEKEELGQKIELDLSFLLPYGEIASKRKLELSLRDSLSEFYFRDRKYEVSLNRLKMMPEGSGAAMLKLAIDQENFMETNQGFVMFGHRNTSLLVFERGSFSSTKSSTTPLGFYNFVDKFREKLPGVEREEVLRIIQMEGKIKYNWNKESFNLENYNLFLNFEKLVKMGADREFVKKAYKVSLEHYSSLIMSWLEDSVPFNLEILNCLGGATPFLIQKVGTNFTNCEVNQTGEQYSEFLKALNFKKAHYPKELIQDNLIQRMMDVWGLFAVFSDYYVKRMGLSA